MHAPIDRLAAPRVIIILFLLLPNRRENILTTERQWYITSVFWSPREDPGRVITMFYCTFVTIAALCVCENARLYAGWGVSAGVKNMARGIFFFYCQFYSFVEPGRTGSVLLSVVTLMSLKNPIFFFFIGIS